MNHPFVRGLLGVTGGLILGFLSIVGFGLLSTFVFPAPKDLNINAPIATLVLVLAGYLVGTLVGSWTATKIGRSHTPGYIVGVGMLCAGISNMFKFPHPGWFWIASIVIFLAMTLLGARLARPAIRSATA